MPLCVLKDEVVVSARTLDRYMKLQLPIFTDASTSVDYQIVIAFPVIPDAGIVSTLLDEPKPSSVFVTRYFDTLISMFVVSYKQKSTCPMASRS